MKIESTFLDKNEIIIKLNGELDMHTVDIVREYTEKYFNDPTVHRILFDLDGIVFIDSSGIGLILGRYKKMQQTGKKMDLICNKPQIKRILEISGVGKVIDIHRNLQFVKTEI